MGEVVGGLGALSPKRIAAVLAEGQKQEREAARRLLSRLESEAGGPPEEAAVQFLAGPDDLGEQFVWVPMQGLPEPWRASARWVVRDGQPVIRDLHVYVSVLYSDAPLPSGGLTATTLRALRTREATRSPALAEWLLRRKDALPASAKPYRKLPRKPRYSDDEVARFAVSYVDAARRSDAPRAELLRRYERYGTTSEDVAEWIRRATDRGFLTAAQGRGDRRPRDATAKLRKWVEALPSATGTRG